MAKIESQRSHEHNPGSLRRLIRSLVAHGWDEWDILHLLIHTDLEPGTIASFIMWTTQDGAR